MVTYLAKGLRLDINNGPGDDSNSAHILAPAFFNSYWNNDPPQAIPKLGQMADAPVQVSIYGLVGAISEQAPQA